MRMDSLLSRQLWPCYRPAFTLAAAGQNHTIKDATVKRFYYESRSQLRQHLAGFVSAYNYAGRLKTLSPYEFIC